MFIRFVSTGGTIDKVYFDALSQFEIGDAQIKHILAEGLVDFDYEIVSLLHKDSLDVTEEDRRELRELIAGDDATRFVVTHGTDTMPDTANALIGIEGKTIVLTGALSPARFKTTDASFNVGMAVATAQVAPPGVYIAMSGQVFKAGEVQKNRDQNKFEPL